MTGCGKADYSLPYDTYSTNSSYTIKSIGSARKAETFAADLLEKSGIVVVPGSAFDKQATKYDYDANGLIKGKKIS